jgi:hypothetical protein
MNGVVRRMGATTSAMANRGGGMTSFPMKWIFGALTVGIAAAGFSLGQPPKSDEKKKDEPPTKEELELRKGSREFLYKFTVGEEITSEARHKRTEARTGKEKPEIDVVEIGFKIVMRVMKVSSGGDADIDAKVTRVTFERTGRNAHKYDSDLEKAQEAEGWELYHLAKFSFKVDARGVVSAVRPDAETAAYWKQQPPAFRPIVSEDAVKATLPFVNLPKDLVRRGTDWTQKRTFLDETFGKREVTLNFSYHGSETISGRTFEDIRVRSKAKQSDEKPKYEIVEQSGTGKVSFDVARGNLRDANFEEMYYFNPPGAPLGEMPGEEKKKQGQPSFGGSSGGQAGSAGAPGGLGGLGGGGGKKKKTKEDRKKEEEEAKKRAEIKAVKVDLEHEVKIIYRGKPISSE